MTALTRFCLLLCIVTASGLHTENALAWGARGHRIIGTIAEQHLTAAAQAAAGEILAGDDLATASTWADEMRSATDNPDFWSRYASNWHYVNIEPGLAYSSAAKNPRGDAYSALLVFTAILTDAQVPEGPVKVGLESYLGPLSEHQAEAKTFALKFMLHILGDLQQPLHSGYAADRGGNDIRLKWFGESTNLHSLWDSLLIAQLDLSFSEHAGLLERRIRRMPAAEIRQLEQTDPLLWISEAQQMLPGIYSQHARSTDLGYDYAAAFTPALETQLIRGGLRTANYLNRIFAGLPLTGAP